jgi:hypothetical protein
MMWKASTKAAFGMINRSDSDTVWVVGYYCYDKPTVCVRNCGSGVTTTSPSKVKENVGPYCVVDGYNDCYNRRALARHNEKREAHSGYAPLTFDAGIAKAIQAQLQAEGFTGAISSQNKGKYANCGENIFVLTDQTKLSQVPLTNMASDFWYEGVRYWAIPAGAPLAANTPPQTA